MRFFMSVKRNSSVSKIRALFFSRNVFVKRGLEKTLLNRILNDINQDTLFSLKLRNLKEENYFLGSEFIDENPVIFYGQDALEAEFIKVMLLDNFPKYDKAFLHQEKIREINDVFHLPYLKENSIGNLYLVETIEEFGKESLRGYFDMIPSERRDEIIRVIHNG